MEEKRRGDEGREERKEVEEKRMRYRRRWKTVLLEPRHKTSTNDEGAPQGTGEQCGGVHMAACVRQQHHFVLARSPPHIWRH